MINLKNIKDNFSQIIAITEKNIKLNKRYKLNLVLSFITPLFSIILPLIIMGQIFSFNDTFGPWTDNNYIVYQITSYQIVLIYNIIFKFPSELRIEKMWKTLTALIIAPFNRINLLFGIFLSHLVLISVPFIFLFVICYIYYPISIITIFSVLFLYFLMALIFSGIGLVFGVLSISKESWVSFFRIPLTFLIIFSCLNLPFEFFPEFYQKLAKLNPLYYIFNTIRLVWIGDNSINTLISNPINFIVIIGLAIISPLFGLFSFNYIYKKYGIAGY